MLVEEWAGRPHRPQLRLPGAQGHRQGGGSAIPVRPRLLARLVRAVVADAGAVPVTIKFRMAIDDDVADLPRRGPGRRGRRLRAPWRCTREPRRSSTTARRDWQAIAELKQHVTTIPVLGNGDVLEAFDALRMMRETGCDGVVVGRGCLGRPWLFRDLADAFDGREPAAPPSLGEVCDTALLHADLLIGFFGASIALRHMRKFAGWYLKSFPGVRRRMDALHRVSTRQELATLLAELPRDEPYPEAALRVRRGKSGRMQKVSLPPGYLDDRDSDEPPIHDPTESATAELSGG